MPQDAEPKKRRRISFPAALLAFVLVYIFLNIGFFMKNVSYFLRTPTTEEVTQQPPLTAEAVVFREANTLYIDSLSIEAPIIYVTKKGEAVYQDALAFGAVHYPGTALPGELGNVYIFGHSSDFPWAKGEYKTVFAVLPHIKIGDEIDVTDAEGKVFTYVVIETKVVSPKNLEVLDQHNNERHLLTVQTSYPIGTALERFLAIAELKEDVK